MPISEFTVIEWSPSQKCFHRHAVAEMLRDNITTFKRKTFTDYLPIGIFETDEEADRLLAMAYSYLDEVACNFGEPLPSLGRDCMKGDVSMQEATPIPDSKLDQMTRKMLLLPCDKLKLASENSGLRGQIYELENRLQQVVSLCHASKHGSTKVEKDMPLQIVQEMFPTERGCEL